MGKLAHGTAEDRGGRLDLSQREQRLGLLPPLALRLMGMVEVGEGGLHRV